MPLKAVHYQERGSLKRELVVISACTEGAPGLRKQLNSLVVAVIFIFCDQMQLAWISETELPGCE